MSKESMNMNDVMVGQNIAVLSSEIHGRANQGIVLEVTAVDLPFIAVQWKGKDTTSSMLNVNEYKFKKLSNDICAAMVPICLEKK